VTIDEQHTIAVTRRWVEDIVIGLNLCPFARRVFDADLVRYVVTPVADEKELLTTLADELQSLARAPRTAVETTLLIHPLALADFLDYNDFLGMADQLLDILKLTGVIQVAGFHPLFQFADTTPDAVENYTNRSPFPMLHLLREDSVTEVADDPERLLDIPRRNVEVLNQLGRDEVLKRLRAVAGEAQP